MIKKIKLLSDGYFMIDMGMLVYGKAQYYGRKYRAALKPLLVVTDDEYILIDTGIGEPPKEYRKYYEIFRHHTLERALRNEKLSTDDISLVINTHLHFDHCGNNLLFKNAKFFVQETELNYAEKPHRFQKAGYIREMFEGVNYLPVAGEKVIAEDLRLFPTPGHTPGHQSVIIPWENRKIVYCGDTAPLRENLEQRNIVGILYNPVDALDSIDRLRQFADEATYIFSHDNEQIELSF